jgi:hypothetical protein
MTMKKSRKLIRSGLFVFAAGFLLFSCEDLLEQTPPTDGGNLLPSEAIRTTSDLQEVLVSAYDVLANTYDGNLQNLFNLLGDNLERPVQQDNYTSVWLRNTTIFNGNVGERFRDLSIAILRSNTVIENLDVIDVEAPIATRMEAEARFIRALCHFDAVRGWAHPYDWTPNNTHPGVAIRLTPEIVNAPRATVAEVYEQILADISFAKANLPEMNTVGGEAYADRWCAIALEAEVRFQMHQYDLAYDLANQIITTGPFVMDTSVNRYTWPEVSPEAIFYILSAIRADGNTDIRSEGLTGNYYSGPDQVTTLNFQQDFYLEQIEFGTGRPRAAQYGIVSQEESEFYVTSMFAPTDDRPTNDYNIPVLSLTQMKLIRAESAAELGTNLAQAIEDINDIRERAYGGNVANLTGSETADEIIEAARLERRLEFPVSGQRYHDLKRIGSQGEDVEVRGVPYDCNGMILQFPATEGTDLFPLNPAGGC